MAAVAVSVVATIRNERDSVGGLVRSLADQTRPPDEVVITDGGSTDGTWEVLEQLADGWDRLRVLRAHGGRSRGRNAAIAAARHDAIACIDGGCVAEPAWLEHLIAPLEEGADWVAGFYRPEGTTKSTCLGLVIVYVREEVEPSVFLPSARSTAFRRHLWEEVGGFPEDLDYAEDTVFDERLVVAGYRPAFAGDAVVRWQPPTTYGELARTTFRWGWGDGEAGIRGPTYRRLLALFGGTTLAVVGASAWAPRLVPLAVAPLAASVAIRTRHKYRHAEGTSKLVHIPLAHVTASAAALSGFLAGRAEARS